jgi:hypothetical protein
LTAVVRVRIVDGMTGALAAFIDLYKDVRGAPCDVDLTSAGLSF